MRIAILWSYLSGYMNACFTELAKTPGVDILLYYLDRKQQVCASVDKTPSIAQAYPLNPFTATWEVEVLNSIAAYKPDVVIVSGWSTTGYRHVARRLHRHGTYVICASDNPWTGTLRQYAGIAVSPWYLHQMFDMMWVPGERAGQLARKLGFSGKDLMYGLYTADTGQWMPVGDSRIRRGSSGWAERFLFVGKLEQQKGVLDLMHAYQNYRTLVHNPWDLWVVGAGPLAPTLEGKPGIRLLGYLQPDALREILPDVGAFVLPSYYDAWPLVVHEMTCAALPILCSRQCGSSVEIVQEGLNGLRFEAGDRESLASLMVYISQAIDCEEYGTNSYRMAMRYSTANWARNLIELAGNHSKS